MLQDLTIDVGLAASDVRTMLAGQRFSDEVRAEQARAARLGVRGVRTAVVDERTTLPLLRPVTELKAAVSAAIADTPVARWS